MRSPVSTKVTSLRCEPRELRQTFTVGGGQREGALVGVPAGGVEAALQGGRWRFAADAGDAPPVGSVVGELDGVEAGHDVRPGVGGTADLVEQLGGDGVAVDHTTGPR